MSNMPRERVLEEKRSVSAKISDLSRYIGFGLVAAAYAVLTSDGPKVAELFNGHTSALLGAAFLGASTVVCDYLQYLCGYFSVNAALRKPDSKYDDRSLAYRGRRYFFVIKQVTALSGAVIFGWIIGRAAFA